MLILLWTMSAKASRSHLRASQPGIILGCCIWPSVVFKNNSCTWYLKQFNMSWKSREGTFAILEQRSSQNVIELRPKGKRRNSAKSYKRNFWMASWWKFKNSGKNLKEKLWITEKRTFEEHALKRFFSTNQSLKQSQTSIRILKTWPIPWANSLNNSAAKVPGKSLQVTLFYVLISKNVS